MAKSPDAISDLFNVPSRFMRSVQLERDFFDPSALDHYIVTPQMAEAFQRIAAGLAPRSSRRAWRITGDYGVGKSSFALVLAHLLADPNGGRIEQIARTMGWNEAHAQAGPFWPVLVTGAREGMVSSIARGFIECLNQHSGAKASKAVAPLIQRAEAVAAAGDPVALEELIGAIRTHAAAEGAGVLLIVDELGKLLEHAAHTTGREDVFILQRLAEMASRSGDQPFLFIGLLHQGFQAYAERLPTVVRAEWEKVAERFDELVFAQPLAHTAALVTGALGVEVDALSSQVCKAAEKIARSTSKMGWLSGATSAAGTLQTAPLYPLHPALLPALVRFFSRFGQHERSLFGFLLSSEPFALQAFAAQPISDTAWYGVAEFYDYIRSNFGHRLAGGNYVSHWLRIAATVDSAHDLSEPQIRTLKVVAVLNLLDADDLLATDAALEACLAPTDKKVVTSAIGDLVDRGLLFRRGANGGYRLWPNSSLNLREAFENAKRSVGQISNVSSQLEPFLEREPILARKHYLTSGTMRFFEIRYAAFDQVEAVAAKPHDGDGVVLIALADTPEQQRHAVEAAKSPALANGKNLIIGVSSPLSGLASLLQDLKCWQWVFDKTGELNHDSYARAEVLRQLSAGRRAIAQSLGVGAALRARHQTEIHWLRQGRDFPTGKGLSNALSELCDALFDKAPLVFNELLNRNTLSSPAAAARMRLIEGIFDAVDRPLLGIDPVRAPPEKSMYLSVIKKGGLHTETTPGQYVLTLPIADADPLRLAPVINELTSALEAADGGRIPVSDLLARIAGEEYGVRAGLAPIILALVVKARAHELAVYENGTFRAAFGGQDFMRLIKAPATFDLQYCRIEGVRAEVFARLAMVLNPNAKERKPQVLEVVAQLCRFAAQLPEYTRKAGSLEGYVSKVRDTLLSATEPTTMVFRDLPIACGLKPFSGEEATPAEISLFIERLHAAMEALRADYPLLLKRFTDTVAATIAPEAPVFDRAALAARAARVALVAKLPKLKTFANRLRDPGVSDEAWATALASFLLAKPPARWNSNDEIACLDELSGLVDLFRRAEFAAFGEASIQAGDQGNQQAVRISLTKADGEDRIQVITDTPLPKALAKSFEDYRDALPQGKDVRLQFLMKLLWAELHTANADSGAAEPQATAQTKTPGAH